MEDLSQVQKKLEKKDFDLKLALERLRELNSALQHALRDKEVELEKCREAESLVQYAHNKEKTAREMVDGLLFEMEKEKVTFQCKMDQLWSDWDETLK